MKMNKTSLIAIVALAVVVLVVAAALAVYFAVRNKAERVGEKLFVFPDKTGSSLDILASIPARFFPGQRWNLGPVKAKVVLSEADYKGQFFIPPVQFNRDRYYVYVHVPYEERSVSQLWVLDPFGNTTKIDLKKYGPLPGAAA